MQTLPVQCAIVRPDKHGVVYPSSDGTVDVAGWAYSGDGKGTRSYIPSISSTIRENVLYILLIYPCIFSLSHLTRFHTPLYLSFLSAQALFALT